MRSFFPRTLREKCFVWASRTKGVCVTSAVDAALILLLLYGTAETALSEEARRGQALKLPPGFFSGLLNSTKRFDLHGGRASTSIVIKVGSAAETEREQAGAGRSAEGGFLDSSSLRDSNRSPQDEAQRGFSRNR